MIPLLLLACSPSVETYRTTGDIYVIEADCVDERAYVHSQHSAAHLLGVEVCYGSVDDGCDLSLSPGSVRRGGALISVDCPASEYGDGAYIRARFLELSLNPE